MSSGPTSELASMPQLIHQVTFFVVENNKTIFSIVCHLAIFRTICLSQQIASKKPEKVYVFVSKSLENDTILS